MKNRVFIGVVGGLVESSGEKSRNYPVLESGERETKKKAEW